MQDIKCLFHTRFTRVTLSEPLEVGGKYCLPVSNRKSSSYLRSTKTYTNSWQRQKCDKYKNCAQKIR